MDALARKSPPDLATKAITGFAQIVRAPTTPEQLQQWLTNCCRQ